jgi:ribose/xylose/arabinose/galactoside ABC-type transport system permease subunit
MTRWRSYVPSVLDNLIWFILIGVVIFFATQTDKFLTPINLRNILVAASVLGILVVGQSFVLITSNFDLSSESTLGLAALIGLFLIVPPGSPTWGSGTEISPFVSIAIILAMGAGIGWVIGALITYGKMNNFIVTLAMLIILRGAMLRFTNGQAVTSIDSRPAEVFNWLGHESAFSLPWLGAVPISVLVMLAVFLLAYVVLRYRPFGRELYAIGGNRSAALASGIDPDKRVRQVYMISGFLAALAGWMLAGRISSVQSDLGEGYIFNVMAAAVIGGISLLGGRGSIVGALGGVLLLSIIDRGLNLMQVSVFWIQSIQGFVILLAMFIDAQKVRFRGPALAMSRDETLGESEEVRAESGTVGVPERGPAAAAGPARGDAV